MFEVEISEVNDFNVIVLLMVDVSGMFNVCMVLLKDIEDVVFVFYINYGLVKV